MSTTTCKDSGQKSINMRIEKHNSLQFLLFKFAHFEKFGDKHGVLVEHIPFELREVYVRWAWLYASRQRYYFEPEGRHDGWLRTRRTGATR